jgi:hypothetical protein
MHRMLRRRAPVTGPVDRIQLPAMSKRKRGGAAAGQPREGDGTSEGSPVAVPVWLADVPPALIG